MSESRIPPFYRRYIKLVDSGVLVHILRHNGKEMNQYISNWSEEKQNYRYAEGKWTAREVVQHMIDAERVFAYRALRFARMDQSELPGFDENAYALTYNEDIRPFSKLIEEHKTVRKATIALFEGFTDLHLNRSGTASGVLLTVREIGEIIAGHEQHHKNILIERYFPEK